MSIVSRLRSKAPEDTQELQRVLALPRRQWWEDPQLDELVETMTEAFRAPGGTQVLRPQQVMALVELHEFMGLLAAILVGGGKTLITYLAGLVVDAVRPVLMVPASLEDKTRWEFDELEANWQRHPNLKIITYTQLGIESGEQRLEELQPDLLIADEVHKLKDLGASCTKRVERYFINHNDCIFCGLSGTVLKNSLMDFHHLSRWAIGPHQMPLPAPREEAERWSLALDKKLPYRKVRVSLGALKKFTPQATRPGLADVQKAFGAHLRETPGFLVTKFSDVDASIIGTIWRPELSDAIRTALRHLDEFWTTPGGELCRQPVDIWRHARELVCGFYYRWEPQPPEAWLKVRAQWHQHVRRVLGQRYRGIDSPLQVEKAVAAGTIPGNALLKRWKEIEATYKHKKVAVWIDESVLEQVIERVEGQPPTLVWVEQTACGEKLAELSGWPYFGEGGRDAKGRKIESLKGKSHAILSINANLEGRNLQAWAHNEVLMPPSNGSITEQFYGRSHREGQEHDEVFFSTMIGSPAVAKGFLKAIEHAQSVSNVMDIPQKLLLANYNRKELSVIAA